MLATLGSSWRRGSKALEPISSFRLLTASILQQPSATLNFGTGFTSFFCIKVPETPIERVRQRHVEGGTDSVMKDSVPELKEASSKVKIALEHLKKPNTSQTPTSFGGSGDASDEKSSTVEWTEEISLGKYKSDEGEDCKSKISQLPDERKLLRELSAKIRFSGPITVAEYMREVAINPIHGFYVSQEALGKHGHFVTSPELSQMFGECVAVWFLHEWMKMGEPQEFQLVELGPGKGTLLTDILRTLTKLQPGLVQGISLNLVEVSPRMRKEQVMILFLFERLNLEDQVKELGIKDGVSKWGASVHWHDHIADVPQEFSFFLAHEFLDALPVNKFERVISEDNAWREVLVDIDEEREGELRYVISRNATPSCVLLEGLDLEGVHKTELCPNAGLYIREVGKRVAECGGAALIVDYGEEQGEVVEGGVEEQAEGDGEKKGSSGRRIERDTLRAFRHHKQVHPLDLPGTADITADVDFSYIRSQVQESLLQSYKTLTDKNIMGARFKVCSIHPATMGEIHAKYPPVGFLSRVQ